jgi:hypothetical protein
VAERINEYAALGIDSFIFSGYPHLEEAYRVGELLFPLLDVTIPSIPQPQPLHCRARRWPTSLFRAKSHKAKEHIMATSAQKLLLRVAPWLLPVGTVIIWQLASSVGWLSTRILPSPEGCSRPSGRFPPAANCGNTWPSVHGVLCWASPSAVPSGWCWA